MSLIPFVVFATPAKQVTPTLAHPWYTNIPELVAPGVIVMLIAPVVAAV